MTASRLQITVYNRLVAEVVGTVAYCEDVWNRWCGFKYELREPFGGSYQCGSGRRPWDVPVGACVYCGTTQKCEHDV